MKFYNREAEMVQLQQLSERAYAGTATMTLLVGRRRIGKTEVLKHCFEKDPNFAYFFISRKAQELLCEEFLEDVKRKFSTSPVGQINTLLGFFEYILIQATTQPLTVVFDEFQDIKYIDESIFSGMQNLWDTYKRKSKIHVIACGSVYSMMCNIFENSKQPLFGRADTKIYLKPLKIDVLCQILRDENQYTPENLLAVYAIAGGVPRYLELLQMHGAWNLPNILSCVLRENSFFLSEGKDVLIEELGKEYKIYFSILALLSRGKTSRSAIESVLQTTIGGYLDNLENEFSVIKKIKPVFATENTRNQKYYIVDHFLNFWFRYIHRHQSAIEIGNYQYVIDLINSEFSTYSGKYLEFMIRDLLAESGDYNIIGTYWEKDNQNEIDIVACNQRKQHMLLIDVKLQAQKLNLDLLKYRAANFIKQYSDYQIEYKGFSLHDLDGLTGNAAL